MPRSIGKTSKMRLSASENWSRRSRDLNTNFGKLRGVQELGLSKNVCFQSTNIPTKVRSAWRSKRGKKDWQTWRIRKCHKIIVAIRMYDWHWKLFIHSMDGDAFILMGRRSASTLFGSRSCEKRSFQIQRKRSGVSNWNKLSKHSSEECEITDGKQTKTEIINNRPSKSISQSGINGWLWRDVQHWQVILRGDER